MVSLIQVVITGSLVLARITGLMLLAPFLSSSAIAMRIKVSLALALTLLLYPAAARATITVGEFSLVARLGSEFAIGALLGLSLALTFEAIGLAGHVLGIQIGFSLVNLLDPQTQVDTPVLSLFFQTIALLIFLRLEIHRMLISALARSYEYLPVSTVHLSGASVEAILHGASAIWFTGLQIAAPALLATMAIDVILAFVGRAAPQLPALFIGLSFKNLIGGAVIVSMLLVWPDRFSTLFSRAVETGEQWMHLVG